MKKYITAFAFAVLFVAAAPAVHAGSAYPLKTCIVTNDDLGDDPINITYKGRLVRLCCKSCVKKFNANPEKYVAILNQQTAKRAK